MDHSFAGFQQIYPNFTFGPRYPRMHPDRLEISVCDEGEGFVGDEVADPLAPENMLKSSGRGIFFMRSFMDDVRIARHPEGGMEVRLLKKLVPRSA